jgi:hypothetical protein
MKDRLHATHAVPHARAVRDRAHMRGKWRLKDIEADDLVLQFFQRADQGLAKVTGTSCNENLHDRPTAMLQ